MKKTNPKRTWSQLQKWSLEKVQLKHLKGGGDGDSSEDQEGIVTEDLVDS